MKFTDSLVLTMELRSHSSRIDQLDDHLLADIGQIGRASCRERVL